MRDLTPLDNAIYALVKSLGMEPFILKFCDWLANILQRVERVLK